MTRIESKLDEVQRSVQADMRTVTHGLARLDKSLTVYIATGEKQREIDQMQVRELHAKHAALHDQVQGLIGSIEDLRQSAPLTDEPTYEPLPVGGPPPSAGLPEITQPIQVPVVEPGSNLSIGSALLQFARAHPYGVAVVWVTTLVVLVGGGGVAGMVAMGLGRLLGIDLQTIEP